MEWLIIAWFAIVAAGPITAEHKHKKEVRALKAQVAACQEAGVRR